MNKRSFLKKITLFLTGLFLFRSSLAKTLISNNTEQNLKTRKRSFLKAIFSRYHNWHRQKYFDFDKRLSSAEKQYIALCQSVIPTWNHKFNKQVSLSYITYSHRVKNHKVNSSRLSCGTLVPNKALQSQMLKIMKQRNIKLPKNIPLKHLAGLGWDFEEDHFKQYYYYPNFQGLNQKQREFVKKYSGQSFKDVHPVALYSKTYKGNKEHEEKIYLYLKDKTYKSIGYPKENIKNVTLMITNKRGVVPQYDLVKNEFDPNNHFNTLFNEKGQDIIKENENYISFAEHGSYTLNYKNPNDFTLYFF